jgi:ABC-2 type transport system permease protein
VVAELARLKFLLTWNGLKKDWQRRIGLPAVITAMGWIAWKLASAFISQHGLLSPQQAGEFSMWVALGFFIGWVALPVVIFPLDETLDPAQLAVFPIPRLRLLVGLAIASLIGPSVVVPSILVASNIWLQDGWARVIALAAGVVFIAQMAVASHLFTGVISALLRSRRGRDLAVLVVVGIGLFTFGGYQIVNGEVDRLGVEGALAAYKITDWAALVPPVAAQRAVVEARHANGEHRLQCLPPPAPGS